MSEVEITIRLDDALLQRIDALVAERWFDSRSQAIETMLTAHVERLRRTRLAAACAALDRDEERALAEEGIRLDAAKWPVY